MDINYVIERKDIDFEIPKNLLIREVEDSFIIAKNSINTLYSNLSKSDYDEDFKLILRVAKAQKYKLNDFDALSLAQIHYLNNKDAYDKMITDFYIENEKIADKICSIKDIEEAKPEINTLTSSISIWLDSYLEKRGKENMDLTTLFEKTKNTTLPIN